LDAEVIKAMKLAGIEDDTSTSEAMKEAAMRTTKTPGGGE
jgi:hypothetical protein